MTYHKSQTILTAICTILCIHTAVGKKVPVKPDPEKRIEMLIQLAGIEGVPRIQLDGHAQVNEPVILQCLPKIPGGVGRDASADLSDTTQLLLAPGVLLLFSQLPGLLGMTSGEQDQSIGADAHRPELLPFVVGIGIVQEIEVLAG